MTAVCVCVCVGVSYELCNHMCMKLISLIMSHYHCVCMCTCVYVTYMYVDSYLLLLFAGLIHRAILLSGSALSPWSIIPDPDSIREEVSQQMACHLDTNGNNRLTKDITNDITNCLRSKPLQAIMGVRLPAFR